MRHIKTFLLLLSLIDAQAARAAVSTLALSSQEVTGIPGAEFGTFGTGKINATGDAVFTAYLADGVGGITPTNDHTLLTYDGAGGAAVIAQEGNGNVPGVVGADFADFLNFSIDDAGTVTSRARLADGVGGVTTANYHGLWQFTAGAGLQIARTSTANAPGVPARFESLDFPLAATSGGRIAFEGSLLFESGVSLETNDGIWSYQGGAGSLVLRENDPAPDVPTAVFGSFNLPDMNDNGQFAERGILKLALGVTAQNRTGIWLYQGGTGQLIARTGVGNVPGLPAASFLALSNPAINESGELAYRGQLMTGEEGLWRFSGTSGTNVAIGGQTNVPDVAEATFSSFSNPLFYDSGKVVTLASLTVGTGGVTSASSFGLWLFPDDATGRLLLREGSGGVPDVAGANFDGIEYFAPTDEGLLVQATLEAGTGDVTAANNQGIWHVPFVGDPELLLRKGDQLAGHTIAALTFPTSEVAGSPLQDVSNNAGQFLFRADFTNGDSGLFLYSPDSSSEFAPADFNTDGFVDGDDLAAWQDAYGTTSLGDADNDGDTDGRDFLIWQRQYTGSATLTAVNVPEPGVLALLTIAFGIAQARILSRGHRRVALVG